MKTAHEYMIALTADERTPSVKAMVDIILLDAAKAIDVAREDGYDEGFSDGTSQGYAEGLEEGRSE